MDRPPYPEALRQYFRAAAAKRRTYRLLCDVCHQPTKGLATRRYCSNACRQRAKRQRAAVALSPSLTPPQP